LNNFIQAGTLVVPTAPLPTVSTGTHGQGTTTGGNLQQEAKRIKEIVPQLEEDCDEASAPSARAY
jgi:hypothetical protein